MSDRPRYEQPGWQITGNVYNIAGATPATASARPVVLPYPRNLAFGGRDVELSWLAEQLAAPDAAVVITAEGGTGKTQLAAEFARRCAADAAAWPGGVMWIGMAQADAVPTTVVAAGVALGVPGYASLPLDAQLAAVRAAWATPERRLLVFDNCEDPALLRAWRPAAGSGTRVLVTARRTDWPAALVQRYPLPSLPRPAALRLLLGARASMLNVPVETLIGAADAETICAELGDHALALHLAGAFLAQRPQLPLARFLADVRAQMLTHTALQTHDPDSPTGYPRGLAETIALSYALLDLAIEVDANACDVLALAAHCAPSMPIPLTLLQRTFDAEEDELHAAAQRLVALGLANYAEGGAALGIHRLVAAYARQLQDEHTAATYADRLVETLCVITSEIDEGSLAQMLPLLAHAQHVADVAETRQAEHAATLLNNIGEYFKDAAGFSTARSYHTRALALRENLLGAIHPDVALSLNNLGGIARAEGDFTKANEYLTQALNIDEQAVPRDAINIAYDLNNLGNIAQAQGRYQAAYEYLSRSLAILEAELEATHPLIATSLNNLGAVAQDEGNYAAARNYFLRALTIDENVLPAGHPSIAVDLNNLGLVARAEGDYAAAQAYFHRALVIWEQTLPANHPNIATSLNNLGEIARAEGNYQTARKHLTRALAIWDQTLSDNHPDMALSLNNLGLVAYAEGDYPAAREYLARTLAIWEQTLPPDHPNIGLSLNNLGTITYTEGNYIAARDYFNRARAIWEATLPPEHPHLQLVQNNLAVLDIETNNNI